MEVLFVVVPVLALVIWLGIASLRHERRRLDRINEPFRVQPTLEQRFRNSADDLSREC